MHEHFMLYLSPKRFVDISAALEQHEGADRTGRGEMMEISLALSDLLVFFGLARREALAVWRSQRGEGRREENGVAFTRVRVHLHMILARRYNISPASRDGPSHSSYRDISIVPYPSFI